ncbi:hypothetical protein VCSRO103_3610 [Vibrio cholerae]|nr:hypothetical protein VCSRO103_3610 [Vibrio cholerae]
MLIVGFISNIDELEYIKNVTTNNTVTEKTFIMLDKSWNTKGIIYVNKYDIDSLFLFSISSILTKSPLILARRSIFVSNTFKPTAPYMERIINKVAAPKYFIKANNESQLNPPQLR